MEGVAIQLISFDRQGSTVVPKFHSEALKQISQQYKTHKVAFISSCGAGKQGKSFILNFVLRSLQKQFEGEDDYLDWDEPDQPLKGFKWTNSEEKTTDGIWITVDPILIKNSKNEDVAVFLIDTQGIFDEYSTDEESSFILGTCFLLSTTTLFSMKAELSEEKIGAIAGIIDQIRQKIPDFQLNGLMFLIKDWTVQQDYIHGEQGGLQYLQKRLTPSPNHPQGPKHAREIIREHVRNLSAFLFPHPGEKASRPEFTGSLEEILPKFTKVLEAFLLSPNLLDLRLVKFTGESALAMVDSIIEAISNPDNNASEGDVTSINSVSSNLSPAQLADSLTENYKLQLTAAVDENDCLMSTEDFNVLHKTLLEAALEQYQPDQAFGFKEGKAGESRLKQRINDFYVTTKGKIEKQQKATEFELESITSDIVASYEEQLLTVACTWNDDKVSNSTSLKAKKIADEAIEEFLVKTSPYKEDLVKNKEQRLKNLLKRAFDNHVAEKKRLHEERLDAQFDFKIFELLIEYREQMKKYVADSTDTLELHNKYVNFKLSTLSESARPADVEKLKQAYEQEYEKLLQGTSQVITQVRTTTHVSESPAMLTPESMEVDQSPEQRRTNSPNPFPDSKSAENLMVLDEAYMRYSDHMNKFLQQPRTESELESYSKTSQQVGAKYIESQIKSGTACPNVIQQFQVRANRDYSDIKAANQKNINAAHDKFTAVLEALKNEYKERISADQLKADSEPELRNFHSKISDELIEKIKNIADSRFISVEMVEFELKAYLDKFFNESILKEFRLKQRQANVDDLELRVKLTTFYDDAMEKHFKIYPFTKPADFLMFHGLLEKKALRQFEGKSPNYDMKIKKILNQLFIKYNEMNDMNTPGEAAIGIDLGTTYCCVAIYQHGKVDIIKNEIGKSITPSYVALLPGGELIGEDAKLQAHENPQSTIFDAKRLIGRKFNDNEVREDVKLWPFKVVDEGDDIPKIEANGRKFPPEVISAKILKHIKKLAEKHLKGTVVKNAVITVPAYFGDGQRQATKDAAAIAGLEVLQIINEPTAAAFAYHLHRNTTEKQNVLIYDLGGGTFDVSVLTMAGGKIEVKAVGGDTHLGGEDFDQALVNFCVQKFQKQHGINLAQGKNSLDEIENVASSRILRRLRNECEKRKQDLSAAPTTTINVSSIIRNIDLIIPISRADFEEMNLSKFNKTITIVQKALLDAKLRKEDIHEVVLVGGSTRIPKIQELLSTFFNGKELCKSVNADEAVAYGAAIQAAILNGTKEQKLQGISLHDVTPMSLGIELHDGSLSVIIPRNTSVPVEVTEKDYTTAYDNQTSFNIKIFEGEDKTRAANNNLLGNFILRNIPRNKKGVEKLHVTMKVDAEGILHVSALNVSNKSSGNIVIDEHKGGLTSSQIEEERRYLDGE